MWEIISGNVVQSQECRRCRDERVLKFKVNFERRRYSQIIVFLRGSIVHDVLINISHPKGSEKYCLKMSAGLSCATSFQRSPPRLLTISPDLLRKFIYTWCFNQCQSPERYWNISENVSCTSKNSPITVSRNPALLTKLKVYLRMTVTMSWSL